MVNKFFDGMQDRVQAAAQGAPTTEQKLGDILSERERIGAQMLDLATNGSFGDELLGYDDYGNAVMGQSGDAKQLGALADTFDILGDLAKTGSGAGGGGEAGGLSANTMAQIAQQDRQLAESMRQFNVGEARAGREFSEEMAFGREGLQFQRDQLATTESGAMSRLQASIASEEKRAAAALQEEQRRNNLSSTLDLLTNQIRTGELGVAEASNRISAATNAANVQRDILADHAGKALPAGTTHFPNLGANGPIAAMAGVLGQPFVPFETMGTFGIDPNAIAAPISSAPGDSMMPGANDAVAAAARALAGMGVPQMAEGGPVSGPYISGEAGPELNFPQGDGQSFVLPLRDMVQRRAGGGPSIQPVGSRPTAPPFGPNPMGSLFPGGQINFDPQQWFASLPPHLIALAQALQARPTGAPPPTGQGAGLRSPQMGQQAAARALAGM